MKIVDALRSVQLLAVETAPFIYFVENHTNYADRMEMIFKRVDSGDIQVITSTITLTEVLTKPLKTSDHTVAQDYRDLLTLTPGVRMVMISAVIAERAADLRARYGLKTPDALQVATAIETRCQAFLTNDLGLKRVQEITVLVLDELQK